ncbi:MAG: hypothetical protein ABJC74_09205 [Gemmatimonadota bacterium]
MNGLRWAVYVAIASQLLPPAVALLRPTADRTRSKVVLWCLVLFLFDMLESASTRLGYSSNLWLEYIFEPTQALLTFWILYDWQAGELSRLAIRFLAPIFLVAMVSLTLLVKELRTFSLMTTSLTALVLLCLALYTLLTRSLSAGENPARFDWFWICSGYSLYFIGMIGYDPILRRLMGGNPDAAFAVPAAKSVSDTIAMLMIAKGLLCTIPQLRSRGSSSPRSSRPLSFS